jgi:serine-type D-Ala-D-Ala carboxypeptidase (penicillin-binding protein 5/6)
VASTVLQQGIGDRRTRRGVRSGVFGALVAVVLVMAFTWRITTETTPPLVVHRTLAAYVRVPGAAPVLAWPREGQAAVEVEGVGSLGTSGLATPAPIASVAKVMTAYLTLLEHPLAVGAQGFTVTITPAEVTEQGQRVALDESTLGVRVGERLTERQALQALMLPSANNIAALLARYDAGDTAAFVARMNATARALGMDSTTYTDPSGFEPTTVSTATDQLRLARAAMQIPALRAIVDEPSAVLPGVGRVANYNGLVGSDGYIGVKTGSDGAAGGCLMFAKRTTVGGHGVTVLGVVLGQREGSLIESALTSAQRLGDSAAAGLRVETVLPAGTSVLSASSADGRSTTAVTASPLQAIGWGGLALPVRVVTRPAMKTLRAGEPIAGVAVGGVSVGGVSSGEASVGASGGATGTTSAVAMRSVGSPSLGYRLRHLL